MARASMPPERELNRFLAAVGRYGKGRIRLNASIEQDGSEAVRFEGTFALLEKGV
jgi:hypothetical protein